MIFKIMWRWFGELVIQLFEIICDMQGFFSGMYPRGTAWIACSVYRGLGHAIPVKVWIWFWPPKKGNMAQSKFTLVSCGIQILHLGQQGSIQWTGEFCIYKMLSEVVQSIIKEGSKSPRGGTNVPLCNSPSAKIIPDIAI